MKEFADIRIVDLDAGLTGQSDRAPGLRHMFLKLSQAPSPEWVQIFRNERAFPRHTMWRHAWIEGSHIVIDCVPEEIEKYHLSDLKQDVENSNSKYREYLREVHQRETQQKQAEEAEKRRLDELRGKLDFS